MTPDTFPFALAMDAYRANRHPVAFHKDALLAHMFCCGAYPDETFDAGCAKGDGSDHGTGPWLWACYLFVLAACDGRETITPEEFSTQSLAYSTREVV